MNSLTCLPIAHCDLCENDHMLCLEEALDLEQLKDTILTPGLRIHKKGHRVKGLGHRA